MSTLVRRVELVLVVISMLVMGSPAGAQSGTSGPDTVEVLSGTRRLRGLLWLPAGAGPFPAVLFNHGSGPADLTLAANRLALGPVFVRHGYAFFFLFRRGSGLSSNQGSNSFDVITRALAEGGQAARNHVQLRLLQTDDLADALAGLAALRRHPNVDPRRVALVGHSFGGSLTLLMAERDSTVPAAIVFGAAANSWETSPLLQQRLLTAVGRTAIPVFFIHAVNDYSVTPGRTLADEMARLGKRHRFEIYPAVGRTPEAGHDFVFLAPAAWEENVFDFLDKLMRR